MSTKHEREAAIFDFFQKKQPDFAGRTVTYGPGNDPPDFLCTDEYGKRIGIELGEWTSEAQMKMNKEREAAEKNFTDVIRSEDVLRPLNIGMVFIGRKPDTILKPSDRNSFREELYALVEITDEEWPRNRWINASRGYLEDNLSACPMLAKYLYDLSFIPTSKINLPKGVPWVDFRGHADSYPSKSAIDALAALVQKKTAKYVKLHAKEKLGELYLIAYFDQGLFYNTPYDTIGVGFSEIGAMCGEWFAKNPGRFQKAFLFDSTGDGKIAQVL